MQLRRMTLSAAHRNNNIQQPVYYFIVEMGQDCIALPLQHFLINQKSSDYARVNNAVPSFPCDYTLYIRMNVI